MTERQLLQPGSPPNQQIPTVSTAGPQSSIMELKTRRVQCAECTPNPDEIWMKQITGNLPWGRA